MMFPSTDNQNSAIPDINPPSQSPETSPSRKEFAKPISACFSTVNIISFKSNSVAQETSTQQSAHPSVLETSSTRSISTAEGQVASTKESGEMKQVESAIPEET